MWFICPMGRTPRPVRGEAEDDHYGQPADYKPGALWIVLQGHGSLCMCAECLRVRAQHGAPLSHPLALRESDGQHDGQLTLTEAA